MNRRFLKIAVAELPDYKTPKKVIDLIKKKRLDEVMVNPKFKIKQ